MPYEDPTHDILVLRSTPKTNLEAFHMSCRSEKAMEYKIYLGIVTATTLAIILLPKASKFLQLNPRIQQHVGGLKRCFDRVILGWCLDAYLAFDINLFEHCSAFC